MSQFHNNRFAVGWLVERLGLNAVNRRRKQWSHFSSSPRGALSAGEVVAGACQILILSHADTMTPSDAFVDDSMDRQDALAASLRFTVHRTPEGIRVQAIKQVGDIHAPILRHRRRGSCDHLGGQCLRLLTQFRHRQAFPQAADAQAAEHAQPCLRLAPAGNATAVMQPCRRSRWSARRC